jgi:hypothetical protein
MGVIKEDRMKRILLCFCAACLAAAIAAPVASALFELDYNGRLKHHTNSYTGFNVKKSPPGKRKATFFTSRGLPYKCDTGSSGKTPFITLDDSFRIVRGEFEGTSHVFTPQGDPVAHVDGKISNGSAHGTLRISGKLNPQDSSASCKTGTRSWIAERAAAPAP